MQTIILTEHNPAWARLFLVEAKRLKDVFGGEIVSIEHAGSTSIQGIKAKPILDFVITVQDIEKINAYDGGMVAIGYEVMGENGIPGRRFFTKIVDGRRVHNVHIFQIGHPEIERMLLFRNYLRAHPVEAKAYSQLKELLAQQYPQDIESYTEGKSEFINQIIDRANQQRDNLGS